MLENLSREEILELYLALRRDYFDVTMELVDQERALRQAYALIEKRQSDAQVSAGRTVSAILREVSKKTVVERFWLTE
jgi:hypothetical protein